LMLTYTHTQYRQYFKRPVSSWVEGQGFVKN
jgi:hypothetical protein